MPSRRRVRPLRGETEPDLLLLFKLPIPEIAGTRRGQETFRGRLSGEIRVAGQESDAAPVLRPAGSEPGAATPASSDDNQRAFPHIMS